MADHQTTRRDPLDDMILPTNLDVLPTRSDVAGWLHVSQVALTNIRWLVARGKSETAETLAAHYWRRWAEARK